MGIKARLVLYPQKIASINNNNTTTNNNNNNNIDNTLYPTPQGKLCIF